MKWTRKSEKTLVKKEKKSQGECVNPVSVEAFDIFSQGKISECDTCGVNSDCACE